jgi:apolipoprotein N-acyltransferase
VAARTPIGAEATLRAEVPLLAGRTVYARLGDWPGPLAALLVAGGLRRKKIIPAL